MDEETLAILGEAAMLDGAADLLGDLTALADRINSAASSRKAETAAEGPVMLKKRAAEELRGEEDADADRTDRKEGIAFLAGSGRFEEPYVTVPRVV